MPNDVNNGSPALSVAMSVYNAEAYLALAIESILGQSMPSFEFLILNDGSTDRCKEIIEGYAARDNRIRASHRENKGLIVSLNELVAAATAPLCAAWWRHPPDIIRSPGPRRSQACGGDRRPDRPARQLRADAGFDAA